MHVFHSLHPLKYKRQNGTRLLASYLSVFSSVVRALVFSGRARLLKLFSPQHVDCGQNESALSLNPGKEEVEVHNQSFCYMKRNQWL